MDMEGMNLDVKRRGGSSGYKGVGGTLVPHRGDDPCWSILNASLVPGYANTKPQGRFTDCESSGSLGEMGCTHLP